MSGETVLLPSSIRGMILTLERSIVKVTLFGSERDVMQGGFIFRTKAIVSVTAGPYLLGCVLDSIGNFLGKARSYCSLSDSSQLRVGVKAPGIIVRQSVFGPLHTRLKALGSTLPIGRGQRELVIGGRQAGKTRVAVDPIVNQAKSANTLGDYGTLYSVYVAIGQKKSSVSRISKSFKKMGSRKSVASYYASLVSATSADSAAMQYLAPYTGCTVGEFFRDNGMRVVAIYGDLSKQAVSYRQMSLLLRRPPARDASPGDVFYLHSRLLERAAKLSPKNCSGSLSARPVIGAWAGGVSSFVPTKVISITDGQIFWNQGLLKVSIRPAVGVGISVSRVGSLAQTRVMEEVMGGPKA